MVCDTFGYDNGKFCSIPVLNISSRIACIISSSIALCAVTAVSDFVVCSLFGGSPNFLLTKQR